MKKLQLKANSFVGDRIYEKYDIKKNQVRTLMDIIKRKYGVEVEE